MEYEGNKHYIRLDGDKIIKGFSTAFEQPQEGDVLIAENAGRHFELGGQINPPLTNDEGIALYKWDGTAVIERTQEEIQADIDKIPSPPKSEVELLRERIKVLEDELVKKDVLTRVELKQEEEIIKS